MPKSTISVRIPQITSLETAISLYYERIELSNDDIRKLFGHISSATISKMKKLAREKMIENHTPFWNAQYINTEVAYQTWGLEIGDLERRYKKIKAIQT